MFHASALNVGDLPLNPTHYAKASDLVSMQGTDYIELLFSKKEARRIRHAVRMEQIPKVQTMSEEQLACTTSLILFSDLLSRQAL